MMRKLPTKAVLLLAWSLIAPSYIDSLISVAGAFSVRHDNHGSHHVVTSRRDNVNTEQDKSNTDDTQSHIGIRLNKVFKDTHSRRSADTLIADGRVRINGETVNDMGRRVIPFHDVVELDGQPYTGWEDRQHGILPVTSQSSTTAAESSLSAGSALNSESTNVGAGESVVEEDYIKFWKPVGVTSTTDRSVPGNLIDALQMEESKSMYSTTSRTDRRRSSDGDTAASKNIEHRIFSVGRLDKDSSGLLLLTSDGRIPNAVLRKEFKRPKVYRVRVNKPIQRRHVELLRAGIVITTDTVRQGRHRAFTAPTLPCDVRLLRDPCMLEITLSEGRNRQIRVMMKTVGDYSVLQLHRVEFMGIDLSRLNGPGDWTRLDANEMQLLKEAMRRAQAWAL